MTTRRHFLRTAAAAPLAFGAVPLLGQKSDKKYRTALIGSGWWGMNILREAMASQRISVCALCDADTNVMDNGAEDVKASTGDRSEEVSRLPRAAREGKAGDRDHRHARPLARAPDHRRREGRRACLCRETHRPHGERKPRDGEGRAGRRASWCRWACTAASARITSRPCACSRPASPARSAWCAASPTARAARNFPKPNSKPPESMDWEMWCGPAPLRPFNTKIHPGGWRNFLDYANGTMGDWGVHWLDQVLWWSGEKGPKRVFCTGGRSIAGPAVLNDKEQTTDAPDHQVATFEFEQFTAVWEHRKFADNSNEKHKIGAYFYGERGVFHIGWRDGWTFYPVNGQPTHGEPQLQEPDGHNIELLWADFLAAIEQKRKPVGDIESAHRSSCLPLLGMLSHKLGRSIQWDADKELIIGDAEANKLLSREYRKPWEYPAM